ncbi:MAG: response regulator transcription factor [Spirochaetales bacterium]|nr:response regulator transcription factor [Spirochaetales bacterium]
MDKIRILLADDQTLFVESLKTVLEIRAGDIEVAGIARNGEEAVAMALELKPDVILMDVRMPVMDGVMATKEIHGRQPETHIIMLTTFNDDEYVLNALHYGAAGYLLKDIPPGDVISAIRAVNEGHVLIAQHVAAKLVDHAYGLKKPEPEGGTGDKLKSLTEREKTILKLISEGHNNSEIAARLYLAEQTVKNYVSVLYSKLGISGRSHAMKLGLGVTEDKTES